MRKPLRMKKSSIFGLALLFIIGSCAAIRELDDWTEDEPDINQSHRNGAESYITTNVDDMNYILTYTGKTGGGSINIHWNDTEKLPPGTYDPKADFKILIHGFLSDEDTIFPVNVKEAYVEYAKKTKGLEYNIIVVDWAALAGEPPRLWQYETAKENVENVGKRVGEMIFNLVKTGVIKDLKKVHLVGLSLGAHVSGKAGDYFKTISNQQIGRISGLDPAGPGFDSRFGTSPIGRSLNKEDAVFVDVYHTNPGSLWSLAFALGTKYDVGQVDFWPNQLYQSPVNPFQPQCKNLNRYKKFEAIQCSNSLTYSTICAYVPFSQKRAIFGEHCSPNTATGQYYLEISIPEDKENSMLNSE